MCFENSPASDSKTRFLPLNLETASIVRLTSSEPVAFAIKLFVALVLGLWFVKYRLAFWSYVSKLGSMKLSFLSTKLEFLAPPYVLKMNFLE